MPSLLHESLIALFRNRPSLAPEVLAEALSLPTLVTVAGGALVTLGLLVFCANLVLVVHRHAGRLRDLLRPTVA